jgi:hypothetical protein
MYPSPTRILKIIFLKTKQNKTKVAQMPLKSQGSPSSASMPVCMEAFEASKKGTAVRLRR